MEGPRLVSVTHSWSTEGRGHAAWDNNQLPQEISAQTDRFRPLLYNTLWQYLPLILSSVWSAESSKSTQTYRRVSDDLTDHVSGLITACSDTDKFWANDFFMYLPALYFYPISNPGIQAYTWAVRYENLLLISQSFQMLLNSGFWLVRKCW